VIDRPKTLAKAIRERDAEIARRAVPKESQAAETIFWFKRGETMPEKKKR
jgi:hypothetical protein